MDAGRDPGVLGRGFGCVERKEGLPTPGSKEGLEGERSQDLQCAQRIPGALKDASETAGLAAQVERRRESEGRLKYDANIKSVK